MFWKWACVALVVAVLPMASAEAQVSTFDLSGTVKDDQGGVLPGVTVTVRNEETGLTRTVVTDQVGLYYFAALPPQGTWSRCRSTSSSARSASAR